MAMQVDQNNCTFGVDVMKWVDINSDQQQIERLIEMVMVRNTGLMVDGDGDK